MDGAYHSYTEISLGGFFFFYLIVVTWHFHIMKMLIYASDLSIAFKIIIKAAIMIDTLH
jgi:hypothetical protein